MALSTPRSGSSMPATTRRPGFGVDGKRDKDARPYTELIAHNGNFTIPMFPEREDESPTSSVQLPPGPSSGSISSRNSETISLTSSENAELLRNTRELRLQYYDILTRSGEWRNNK